MTPGRYKINSIQGQVCWRHFWHRGNQFHPQLFYIGCDLQGNYTILVNVCMYVCCKISSFTLPFQVPRSRSMREHGHQSIQAYSVVTQKSILCRSGIISNINCRPFDQLDTPLVVTAHRKIAQNWYTNKRKKSSID